MIHIPHTSFSQIREKLEENYLSLQEMRISEIAFTALKYLAIGGLAAMSSGALGIPGLILGISLGFVAYVYIVHNHLSPIENKKPWVLTAQSISQTIIMSCLIGMSLGTLGQETLLDSVAVASFSTGYSLPMASYIFSVESPVFFEEHIQRLEIRTDIPAIQEEILTARSLIQMTTKEISTLVIRLPHIFTPLFLKNNLSPARLQKVFNILSQIHPLTPEDFAKISALSTETDNWNTKFTLSDKTTEELQEKLYRSGSFLLKEMDNYEIKIRKNLFLFQMQKSVDSEQVEMLKKYLETIDQLNQNLESLDDVTPISSGLRFTSSQWKELISALGFSDREDFENTVKRGFQRIGLYTYAHLQEVGILRWGQDDKDLTPTAFLHNIDHFKNPPTKTDLDKITTFCDQIEIWAAANYENMREGDEDVIENFSILCKKQQSHLEWHLDSIKTPNPDFQDLLNSFSQTLDRASDLFTKWALIRAERWNVTHFPIGDLSLIEKELLYKKGKKILSQLPDIKRVFHLEMSEIYFRNTDLVNANLTSLQLPPISSYLHFSEETKVRLLILFERTNQSGLNSYLNLYLNYLNLYTYSDLVENGILETAEDELSYEDFLSNLKNHAKRQETQLDSATKISTPPPPSQRSTADKIFHHVLKLFPTLLSLFLFPMTTIIGIACGSMLRNTDRCNRIVNKALMLSKIFNERIKGPFTFRNPPSREILSIEDHTRRSSPFLLGSAISYDLLPPPLAAFMAGIIEGPQLDEYVTPITRRAKSASNALYNRIFPVPAPS